MHRHREFETGRDRHAVSCPVQRDPNLMSRDMTELTRRAYQAFIAMHTRRATGGSQHVARAEHSVTQLQQVN